MNKIRIVTISKLHIRNIKKLLNIANVTDILLLSYCFDLRLTLFQERFFGFYDILFAGCGKSELVNANTKHCV